MSIDKQEIKTLCQLVRAYASGQITQEQYWKLRDEHFTQAELFEVQA